MKTHDNMLKTTRIPLVSGETKVMLLKSIVRDFKKIEESLKTTIKFLEEYEKGAEIKE